MNIVLTLLLIQCLFGAFDNLWHHEISQRLPAKRSARHELALHAGREFLYGIVFLGLAWREWRGGWAWVLGAILAIEVTLTLADFLEEDRTRRLPNSERVLHTILAVNYGIWLGVFAPYLVQWAKQDTTLAGVDYGWFSIALSVAAAGVFAWSLRNLYVVLKHARPPTWVRDPIYVRAESSHRAVLVTGATGFIGAALVRRLLGRGDAVIVLTRDRDKALDLFGPHARVVESLDEIDDQEKVDCVVNLAGARIIGIPWFAPRRRVLMESRLRVTREVVRLCERLRKTPRVLVNGSAIGFYGVREDEACDEFTSSQPQFQSELCRHWEAAAWAATGLGMRVVLLRTGLVLGNDGALPMMALPVKLFFGSQLGGGRQWMSWVHIDDEVRLIEFALDRPSLSGPLNATAPKPVRHSEFQAALGKQLHRPIWMRVPRWAMHLLLGEMSQLLIDGQRVVPRKSGVHGFRFQFPNLQLAVAALFPKRNARVTAASEVYFNSECPVCNAEMTHYERLAKKSSLPLCFVDSTRHPTAFVNYGLRPEHLEERLYIRDEKGNIASGLAAVLQVWAQLPVYKRIGRVVALPGIYQLAVAGYDLILAPTLARWARWRMRHENRWARS